MMATVRAVSLKMRVQNAPAKNLGNKQSRVNAIVVYIVRLKNNEI